MNKLNLLKIALTLFLFLSCKTILATGSVELPLGAVATQHSLATQTAARILREGGTAVDAAVGAALTLAVVEPYNSGLGAGGMALIWDVSTKKVHAIDFRETAPHAASAEMFESADLAEDGSRFGPLAMAVPGELAGLEWLHMHYGKLPWAQLFQEAIKYAEDGFDDSGELKSRIKEKTDCLSRDYHSAKIYRGFFQAETTPLPFIQKDLAQTLKTIQSQGVQSFYHGEFAKRFTEALHSKGAILDETDLENYKTIERTPLASEFTWGKLWGMPPPTSGGVGVLQGMNLLEILSKKKDVQLQKDWPLWLVGVFGQIFQERNSLMGDPDFVKSMPLKKWISKEAAKQGAEELIKNFGKMNAESQPSPTSTHTTHLSVIDAKGNAVSMTLTLNLSFGSCMTAGDTGIMMNDEMDDFTTQRGKPNAFGLVQSEQNLIAPGKRPLSSMAPTLLTKNEKVLLAIGSPGGPRIITSLLQVLARHFLFDESLSTAITDPKLHYQVNPIQIFLESAAAELWEGTLKYRELPLSIEKPWGNIQAVSLDPKAGKFEAISDPRGEGQGLVVYPSVH